MDGVFINYRRDDSSGWANRLHRDLVDRFGAECIFRDLNLEPGINFKKAIAERLSRCKVQLVLIGPHWLTITDSKGRIRIQKADDLVRAEIAIALKGHIRVIPVRVQNADMPAPDDLPGDISELAEINAVELSDKGWEQDTKELMEVIARAIGAPQSRPVTPREIANPAEPSPVTQSAAPGVMAKSRRPIGIWLWWFQTVLLFIGFMYLSAVLPLMLERTGEQRRGLLALFGACWGLVSWLPVARIVGLKGQIAHVSLAVVSWTIAWSLIWPSIAFIDPQDGPRAGSLSQLLHEFAQSGSMFYARLLALGAIGSTGSVLAVFLRLLWNRELRREVPLLTVLWTLVVYLSYALIVEVLSRGGEYGAMDMTGAFAFALAIGSCVAAGCIRYWDLGNSLLRAIKSVPQSRPPGTASKRENDTAKTASAGQP